MIYSHSLGRKGFLGILKDSNRYVVFKYAQISCVLKLFEDNN